MTLEQSLEQLKPETTMYEPNSGRRIMAGHVSNLYGGAIDPATCALQLRKLATLAAEGADVELETMATTFAELLEVGERPTLVLPELGLQIAPDPAHEVNYGPGDAGVLAEADAAELNKKALEEAAAPRAAAEPEQLTPTQVAEVGAPAPAPVLEEPPA